MNKKTRQVRRAASVGATGDAANVAPSSSTAAPSSSIAAPSSSTAASSSFIPPPSSLSSSLPLVIVNPASAGGATGRAWPGLASDLRTHFGAFACAFTERAGDATVIARREAAAGRRLLIACGGDGTVSEVANGILESGADAELGILPSGTGGDFRRTLGIPNGARDAAAALRTGRSRRVDVGRVEFQTRAGERAERYFLNVASCGMGGEVIRRVEEKSGGWLATASRRVAGGQGAYALASLQAAVSFARPTLRIQLDERPEFRLAVTNLCVANARYFGGGMKIAPEAKLDDALFDVVAVGDLDTLKILTNVYRLYLGTHLGMREVAHTHARRLHVSAEHDNDQVLLEIDGELLGTLPATFELLPRRLSLRV
ncbi:MAG TPA: diacylglycerol kinase family protein [Pyrinomonadaceae bacterium]|nr:diacylglycerol kinase family protein [Pyrinomonadaceae bacterium]